MEEFSNVEEMLGWRCCYGLKFHTVRIPEDPST
jgi:hypothetical protein